MGKALSLNSLFVTICIWVDSILALFSLPFVFLGHPLSVRLLFDSDGVGGHHQGPMSRMYTAMCSLQHDLSNQQFPLYNTWSNRLFSIGDEQPCYQHEAISPTSRHEDFEYVTFPYYHGLDPLANGTESLQDADPHYEIEKTAFSEEWQSMGDDTMVKLRPSAYVDYFSHDWREEDLETSWKCLVAQRHELQNRSRLENALWRTWAQVKNDLDTLPPSKLCWYAGQSHLLRACI